MAILPIVLYGHPVLREQAQPVPKGESVGELIENMFETMRNAQGIGLAANQVGITKRVIVIDISELDQHRDTKPLALINPEILAVDSEWEMEEGCLSIPSVRDVVMRPERIRIRYWDTDFKEHEIEADGILGRVILHEIDHLNGVLFIDHLSPGRRKFHKGLLLGIRRGELEIPYPVIGSEEAVT
jgi:peptide deformylase